MIENCDQKSTIREHLNGAKHIQIARNCMKHLAKLLGCKPNSVSIEGNTSYIDFEQNKSSLTIPFISDKLVVWQMANKIMFSGLDGSRIAPTNLDGAAKELCMRGYEDPERAIAARCIRRKSIVFDLEFNGKIQADYMSEYSSIINCEKECNRLAKMEFNSTDEIAEFIYGQLKTDYEKMAELVVKLNKAMKIYSLKHEKLLNQAVEIWAVRN